MSRRVLVLAVVLTGLAAAPSAAHAAITQSAVTSAVPAWDLIDHDADPSTHVRTFSGTSNGTTGDAIDLVCWEQGFAFTPIATGVPVAADGSWAVTASVRNAAGDRCRWAANPAGNAGLSPSFSGPTTSITSRQRYAFTGANAPKLYDFYVEQVGPTTSIAFAGLGTCGISDGRFLRPDFTTGANLWNCAAVADGGYSPGPTTLPHLRVDGVPAWAPGVVWDAGAANNGLPGALGLTYDAQQDPSTGALTIIGDEPLVRCTTPVSDPDSCGSVVAANVAVERTYRTDLDGQRIRVTDEWRSLDGQPHTVTADLEDGYSGVTIGVRPPGAGAFAPAPAPGTATTGFSGPTTYTLKRDVAQGAGLDNPIGSITMLPAPEAIVSINNAFVTQHTIAVPASGSAKLDRVYVLSADQPTADARAAAAEDLVEPPSLTLDALPATVDRPQLEVAGSAADSRVLAGVTVDGQAATVAGGRFARTVTLAEGANTITVVATDGQGNATTRTATVTFTRPAAPDPGPPATTPTPPPAGPRPAVPAGPALVAPSVISRGRIAVRTSRGRTTVSLGRAVVCPRGGPSCRTTLTAGRNGSTTVTTRPGTTTALTLRLSPAAARTLRAKGRLALRVTITARAGAISTSRVARLTVRR